MAAHLLSRTHHASGRSARLPPTLLVEVGWWGYGRKRTWRRSSAKATRVSVSAAGRSGARKPSWPQRRSSCLTGQSDTAGMNTLARGPGRAGGGGGGGGGAGIAPVAAANQPAEWPEPMELQLQLPLQGVGNDACAWWQAMQVASARHSVYFWQQWLQWVHSKR
jgi:hypothetical protein